ncbi:AAA family ATPase [Streptosporangium sp. KLBMP 9127]|nr:AAA family ATPase [Streptosporangium sp. KLBMP 9127]
MERDGEIVVEEAATDVIAREQATGTPEPWTDPAFIETITDLQRARQLRTPGDRQFYDRSPICTHALATFLKHPIPKALDHEIMRIVTEGTYQKQVLFIKNLGFVTPTEARRISFEESLEFERIHEETYRSYGFECVPIAPGTLPDRAAAVKRLTRDTLP